MSVAALRKQYDESKNKFVAQLQEAFAEEVKAFFDKYPGANTVSWNQYTPYFNDGDECVFSVNEWSVTVNKSFAESDYEGDDSPEAEAFQQLLRDAGDDVLKAAYGDHVSVTVKRDGGVETDDYEHD